MITRGLVFRLGLSQLVCWGISYYLIAIFGEPIAEETGWSRPVVYGGFSLALVVMGATSAWIGRTVDLRGGRTVMSVGSALMAVGIGGIALSHHVAIYYAAWACLGVAMRLTLYDAAFASLARIGGPAARKPISQITLLGGLASTALWPVGRFLGEHLGWRGALFCYAGLALLTIPLHLAIPGAVFERAVMGARPDLPPPLARSSREKILAAGLFVVIVTLASALNAAMSAHMIAILAGLGMGSALAVWTSTLRGVGQSLARLCEIMSGSRLNPLALGVLATAMLPLSFVIGLYSGAWVLAGLAFAFLYGAGNGLITITRGSQPLVLFDPGSYGALVGKLVAPSFFVSALAPLLFAAVVERFGDAAALHLAAAISGVIFLASVALWWSFRPGRAGAS